MIHKKFELNTEGSDFFVGDIHGMFDEFVQCLLQANFDPDKDRVFSVGDLIDRGPDSYKCISLIFEPWFHCVRGNHEDMMINSLLNQEAGHMDNWLSNGGTWHLTVENENGSEEGLVAAAERLDELPYFITVETKDGSVGMCHAQPPCDDWANVENCTPDQIQAAIWGRSVIKHGIDLNTKNIDRTIHGHTPVDKIQQLGNAIFIDTGAVYEAGHLTLMELQP